MPGWNWRIPSKTQISPKPMRKIRARAGLAQIPAAERLNVVSRRENVAASKSASPMPMIQ